MYQVKDKMVVLISLTSTCSRLRLAREASTSTTGEDDFFWSRWTTDLGWCQCLSMIVFFWFKELNKSFLELCHCSIMVTVTNEEDLPSVIDGVKGWAASRGVKGVEQRQGSSSVEGGPTTQRVEQLQRASRGVAQRNELSHWREISKWHGRIGTHKYTNACSLIHDLR